MKAFVFDIETAPDVDAGRILHDLGDDISDDDVMRAMRHLQFQKSGSEFMPLHLHRIVAISGVYEDTDKGLLRVASLGEPESDERELVSKFFEAIENYGPRLVSWNGQAFDLPVLNYRALLHGVAAPDYWDTGERSRDRRFSNYQNRYHTNINLDLMTHLSRYQRGAPLDEISKMIGLPGKEGMRGDEVADAWLEGRIDDIRQYCDTDAVNTYLVYLRYQLISGEADQGEYEERYTRLKTTLGESAAHLKDFGQGLNDKPSDKP